VKIRHALSGFHPAIPQKENPHIQNSLARLLYTVSLNNS
jgi:hypothetical protein